MRFVINLLRFVINLLEFAKKMMQQMLHHFMIIS